MAKAWLEQLLSELHRQSLKLAGFSKQRNTFSRDRGKYVERFNFQGSSWSSSDETVFYLNVGVEFPEFGPAERNWMYFKRTHWACRVDKLVRGAPDDWRCTDSTDRDALQRQLTLLITKASDKIASRIEEFRTSYVERTQRVAARKN